jgi:hypothetical protein
MAARRLKDIASPEQSIPHLPPDFRNHGRSVRVRNGENDGDPDLLQSGASVPTEAL